MYKLLVLGTLVAQEVIQDYYFPFQLSQEFSFSYVDLDGGMVLVRQRDPRVSRYFDLVCYDAEGKIVWEKQILGRRDHARYPGRVEMKEKEQGIGLHAVHTASDYKHNLIMVLTQNS
ncbi:MAG: hypothetical protein ACUVRD_08685 [Bacteroidia bacterium]